MSLTPLYDATLRDIPLERGPAMIATAMPPKPGHTITFRMPEDMTTRQVNRLILDTTNEVLRGQAKMPGIDPALKGAFANYDRRRKVKYPHAEVPAHYSHGFGHSLRDTSTARYTPVMREVIVHYPPNFWGMDHPSTDDWLRTRVHIWDALLFAIGGPDGGAGGITVRLD